MPRAKTPVKKPTRSPSPAPSKRGKSPGTTPNKRAKSPSTTPRRRRKTAVASPSPANHVPVSMITEHVSEEMEFGGTFGCLCLIVWSHYILLYFWYCYEVADGQMVIPKSLDSLQEHWGKFLVLLSATWGNVIGRPGMITWSLYFAFFVVQIVLAAVAPGYTTYGLPRNGHRLIYHCNGYACYYFCLWGLFLSHYFNVIPLEYFAEHIGEFLLSSIIIGDITSVYWYLYGLYYASSENTSTGNVIYDFFMGTVLYPRIGEVDIKMVAEARWSWLTLFILTLSCAAKQYKEMGFVTKEMGVLVLAHWLYSNATVKGEQCIPATWDMFQEKFGWMLNFWNITGVPFLYSFQSFYILKHGKTLSSTLSVPYVVFLYGLLLLGYFIFDTANSQKALYKNPKTGDRNLFPKLPWGRINEPVQCIETPRGKLLVDGWYRYARKAQYTGDIIMALVWGLACGFDSLLPYFYVTFFTCMINHRQIRDEIKCSEKYGEHWKIYVQKVPNVFIPSFSIITDLLKSSDPKEKKN